eukprot:7846357-Alexandrium_andersonii.AAC.1
MAQTVNGEPAPPQQSHDGESRGQEPPRAPRSPTRPTRPRPWIPRGAARAPLGGRGPGGPREH